MLRRTIEYIPKQFRGALYVSSLNQFGGVYSANAISLQKKKFFSSTSGTYLSSENYANDLSSLAKNIPAGTTAREPLMGTETDIDVSSAEVDETVMEELLQEMEDPPLGEEDLDEIAAPQEEEDGAASRDSNEAMDGEDIFENEDGTISYRSIGPASTPSENLVGMSTSTFSSSTSTLLQGGEAKTSEVDNSETMIQSKPNSMDLQVPEMSYRPRLFLYGSVYSSVHPREAGKLKRIARRKASGESQAAGRSRPLISPKRFQELCHWCYNILPAVPVDDLIDLQGLAASTSLSLVSNLYLAEDPKSLWKAYEKKFRKQAKVRTEAEMESFQSNIAQYDLSSITEYFGDIKNTKPGIIHVIKKLREDLDLFVRHQAAIEKGREQISTLPASFLPLNTYPLTIVVSSSLSDPNEVDQLREQIRSAISRSRVIPNNLIHTVASELQVFVLGQEETAKFRDALMEGDVGLGWPDHSTFMKIVKTEENHLTVDSVQQRRAYIEWKAPEARSFHQDPDVVVSEKDIAKALKMIRKRKELALTSSRPDPPEGLFPLQAKVLLNTRTARLSDQVGMVLPSKAHLFVVDAREYWKGNSEEVDEMVAKALKWHNVDGTLLLLNTALYDVECFNKGKKGSKKKPSKNMENVVSPAGSVKPEPKSFTPPNDPVLKKLWSRLQTGRKSTSILPASNGEDAEKENGSRRSVEALDAESPRETSEEGIEVPQTSDISTKETIKGWKNKSMMPLVLVLRTGLSPEKAVEVQRLANRSILRSNGSEVNSICVLSKEVSEEENLGVQLSLSSVIPGMESPISTAWAVQSEKDRPFPLKILKKKELGEKDVEVALIEKRTLMEPSPTKDINTDSDNATSENCLNSNISISQCFFTPYLLSLQSKPTGIQPFLSKAIESTENFDNDEGHSYEAQQLHEG